MSRWLLLISTFFMATLTMANSVNEVRLEQLVLSYSRGEFKENPLDGQMNQQALVTSLWDKVFEIATEEKIAEAKNILSDLDTKELSIGLKLKVAILKSRLAISDKNLSSWQESDWSEQDVLSFLSLKENYGVYLKDVFPEKHPNFKTIESEFKKATRKDEWSDGQISSLLSFEPNWRRRLRGYKGKPRLYMFCRHNREHPCLMLMKDGNGHWHRDDKGKLWSQPKLGLSRHGLPAHQVNGDTPQGIYTLDSVMPQANRQDVFGKFRRLIVNFIESSRNEKDFLSLMPKVTEGLSWWREGKLARDVGRSLLRIHGTGLINDDPASSWYPFYATSGCVASRENEYDGVEYRDQRILLDEMMKASGLSPIYQNETKLTGLLYVMDINSQERPVELADIEPFL